MFGVSEGVDGALASMDEHSDAALEIEDTEAEGGKLSPAGRRAAIAAALPLIAVYFSSGKALGLEDRAAVQRSSTKGSETDVLLAAIRLRASLAASHKLVVLLDDISRRPNFRYSTRKSESVGQVAGRLDVLTYTRQFARVTNPPRYPIIDINRGIETPENTLAYAAGLLIIRELTSAHILGFFPDGGPEHREARASVSRLRRYLQLPAFLNCKSAAQQTLRFNTLGRLSARVRRRVEAGHVGRPGPYRQLVLWVEEILQGDPVATPGEIDWSFYGDAFDTRLFELWCLNLIAKGVSDALSLKAAPLETSWRSSGLAYQWRRPAGTLELFFQKSVQKISSGTIGPRWSGVDGKGKSIILGGVPDIVARNVLPDGTNNLAIIDPKLRQRPGLPTEELYKILGYFENYQLRANPTGVILYHYAGSAEDQSYCLNLDDEKGTLMAVALNPAAQEQSESAIQPVVELILALLDVVPHVHEKSLDPSGVSEDETVISARLDELRQYSAVLGMTLDSSKERVEMILGASYWNALDHDTQVILATAEHVGFTMDPLGDFSAAVVGICSGLEGLLYRALVSEVMETTNGLKDNYTFGQIIAAVQTGLRGKGDKFALALKNRIDELQIDVAACSDLFIRLQEINKQYRNPAAHKDSMSKTVWRSAWRDTLGEGALYQRVMDTLKIL